MAFQKLLLWRAMLLIGGLIAVACSSDDLDEEMPINTENVNTNTSENKESAQVPRIVSKESILAYFDTLIENEQIIVGQQCGDMPSSTASFYSRYVDRLADMTGQYVGLVGADFGWFAGDKYPVQTLIEHWNNGGLVTVSWHADNPFTEGVDVYMNTVENKDKINLKALLRDAEPSAVRASYRNELDKVAGALQELRDANVTVIWRPFHEMNGNFFWWGIDDYANKQTNESDFKALWIDMYNTLKWDYGLDNLIWTYAVVPSETWYANVTAYYPGSDYVDLVGMDYYGLQPDFPHYVELKTLGKTIVMSEIGPHEESYGTWNMMDVVENLKGKAAYFMQWHSWNGAGVSIIDNRNYNDMMNNDASITLEEISPISF
ncbi:glycosyl hydrolase [Aurantibacter sp.]|uniref:glycosyl hydrolase n=1 Tax=Aurantibacter sp. TaxID=2807103 RepID=UPI003266ED4E